MKFMHLADLHIGKRVNEVDLLPDQKDMLEQILRMAREERPDCVLIAGDVYDKTVPSSAAVTVLDAFLTGLARIPVPVCLISGNHDSPERLQFGSRHMEEQGIFIASVFDGTMKKVTFSDAFGPVHVYLLPFVRPAQVRAFAPEGTEIDTYEEAVRLVLAQTPPDPAARNVLVAHQFVTAAGAEPELSDSAVSGIGGLDRVDSRLFDAFDYVALGHLHGPQQAGRSEVRYAGSPLKYSFSEARQKKGVTFVELGEKGSGPMIRRREGIPLHDMRVIRGPLEALCSPEVSERENREDYLRVVLTDEKEILDAIGRVRRVYPNVMELAFDRADREEAGRRAEEAFAAQLQSPPELFELFYERQNGCEMEAAQRELLKEIWEDLGEQAGGREQ